MRTVIHLALVLAALLLSGPVLAQDRVAVGSTTAPSSARNQATAWSRDARGLALGSHFGVVGGSFLLGGNVTSPWFVEMLRVSVAMGVAFYPDALAGDPDAAWTPFGFGHARLEVGTPFVPGMPVRPYAFGGLVLSILPGAMSSDAVSLGGVGGVGIEAGFTGHDGRLGPVTYALEFSGIGSGATVATPARDQNLASGFSAAALIRGYFW